MLNWVLHQDNQVLHRNRACVAVAGECLGCVGVLRVKVEPSQSFVWNIEGSSVELWVGEPGVS